MTNKFLPEYFADTAVNTSLTGVPAMDGRKK